MFPWRFSFGKKLLLFLRFRSCADRNFRSCGTLCHTHCVHWHCATSLFPLAMCHITVSTDTVPNHCVSTGNVPHQCPLTLCHITVFPLAMCHTTVSTGTVPHHSVSTDTVPHNYVFTGTVPHHCISTDTVPHNYVSTGTVPHHCISTGTVPHHCVSTDTVPHHCVYWHCATLLCVHRHCHITVFPLTAPHLCVSTDTVPHHCVPVKGCNIPDKWSSRKTAYKFWWHFAAVETRCSVCSSNLWLTDFCASIRTVTLNVKRCVLRCNKPSNPQIHNYCISYCCALFGRKPLSQLSAATCFAFLTFCCLAIFPSTRCCMLHTDAARNAGTIQEGPGRQVQLRRAALQVNPNY